ncbi:MAG TPA: ABC transporter substrate-binding protein [Anaerolineae bacterium]
MGGSKIVSLAIVSVAWLGLFAMGCAPVATAPTAAPATPVPKTKLQVAFSTLSTQPALMWVAKDAGFFDQNGLDVQLVFIDGGTKTAQALLSQDVQFAFLSPDSLVNANAGGADMVILAGLMNKPYYDLVVTADIKTAADLKGKKVAVSGFSGSSYSAAKIAVRDLLKLDPDKDVVMVATGNQQQREAALLSGQIQASVMDPDAELALQKEGLVILDSLWNKNIAFQHNVIGASKAYVQQNQDTTVRLLKALIQATGYFRSPESKEKVMGIIGKNLKNEDRAFQETAYNRMAQGVLQCVPYATLESMKTIIAESKAAVAKGITTDSVVDNSFVQSLEANGFVKANCK